MAGRNPNPIEDDREDRFTAAPVDRPRIEDDRDSLDAVAAELSLKFGFQRLTTAMPAIGLYGRD